MPSPFARVPWTRVEESPGPLASVTVLTYQEAEVRAEAATVGFEGVKWNVTDGIGVSEPYSISAILSNQSFGPCPTQLSTSLPSPFEITGTPVGSPVGTSAFDEFYFATPSNPNVLLFVVVDNGTAYRFFTVAPYEYSVNGGLDTSSCGFESPLNSIVPVPTIDSSAAVSIANGLGGNAFLAAHPGASVLWYFSPREGAEGPDGYLHNLTPIWDVDYETAGSCGFFGQSGTGNELAVEVDGATGAGLLTETYQCTTEYPISFTESGLPAGTTWSVFLSDDDSNSSDTSSLNLEATNGTTSYAVAGVPGYTAVPSQGSVDINGAGVSVVVTFSAATTYLVTFNETGVSPTVGWSAELNGSMYSTFGSQISFVVVAGSYSYEVGGALGVYTNTPQSGTVNVTTSTVVVPITFTLIPRYPVTVREAGLPVETEWEASAYGSYVEDLNFTSNTSFSILLPNGTFDLEGSSVLPTYNTTQNTEVVVAGSSATASLVFTSRSVFPLTFTEEGLPNGTPWAVGFYEFLFANSSSASSLGFIEPNLTVEFRVGLVAGYSASPAEGGVTIDGASASQTIVFSLNASQPLYGATFSESSLPGGTTWAVTIGGTTVASTGPSLEFNLTNATYSFTVGSVAGYAATPASGDFAVDGASVTQTISFSPVSTTTYEVAFQESGLPSGTNWSVLVNGTLTYSTSTSISFAEPNGSYTFSIGAADGYLPTPASGPITVAGAPVSTSVSFALPPMTQYAVTFSETGLSSGTSWGVALGSLENTSSGPTVGFSVDNGSYFFVIGTVSGYTVAPVNGTILVSGAAVLKEVVFTALPPGEFSVAFTETGLPVGTEWTVSLAGNYNTSTTATIGFVVHNGSYSYTVESVSGYSNSPATGTANVSGTSVTVRVTFSPSPSSSSPQFLGLPATEGYALLGAIVLVIVAAIVALARRGRKGSGSSPPPAPPAGSGGPPPGGTA